MQLDMVKCPLCHEEFSLKVNLIESEYCGNCSKKLSDYSYRYKGLNYCSIACIAEKEYKLTLDLLKGG